MSLGDSPVNPYASFLIDLEKPARYIGGEHFIIRKNWTNEMAKVALCFPDVYEIGMSHLGFKILYSQLNKENSILAERCFAPWMDMEKQLLQRKLPLVSLENFRPLCEFDVLGFSLQYEMSYTNILMMLELGKVPLLSKERKEEDPFVIAGGPCATHPEPLADFLDFVVIGDGEGLFVRLMKKIKKDRQEKVAREKTLQDLSQWEGIYVPSLYSTTRCERSGFEVVEAEKKIERYYIKDLNEYPFPKKSPVPHANAIFDNFSVELARGCTEGCRFCQAGMIYRPVRERKPHEVIETVMEGMKNGGFHEASLTCLSTADYSAVTPLIIDLIDRMKEENASLGVASLRAYGLDERVLDKMAEVKNTSLTFAPEAGSERMRKVINKNVSEKDLLTTAERFFARGFSKMKLYFMIGLPTEEMEDVKAIMDTAKKALTIGKMRGVKRANVTVSVSSFVPKPHTPFQWASMISMEEIEEKQEFLFQLSREYRLSFRKHVSKISVLEGIVARGDRPIGNLILRAYQKGARFDGWNEGFKNEIWMEALQELNIDPQIYLGTLPLDGRLPWDHIDVGLEDKFLEREWKKALHNRLSPPCGKPAGAIVHHSNLESLKKTHEEQKKKLICYHCGITCDLGEMVEERKEFLTSLKAIKDEPYEMPTFFEKSFVERREKRGQNIGFCYRIRFGKVGAISYTSHLDLQKIMSRIFKRASLEVLFSEGYHPRPLFSFGPALPLGISSLGEYFDVRVPHAWENCDEILELLKSHSESGIRFFEIQEISKKETSIQASIKSMSYYFPLEKEEENLEHALEGILKEKELVIEGLKGKAKTPYTKDLRPFLVKLDQQSSLHSFSSEEHALIHEVNPLKSKKGIEVEVSCINGQGVRPQELFDCFINQGLSVQKPIKLRGNF